MLVPDAKFFEVYDKRRKKSNIFLHCKNGGEKLIGYTFCVGYTYRADCMSRAVACPYIPSYIDRPVKIFLLSNRINN